MPLASRDTGTTKIGGENVPEQALRLLMVFLSLTGTQIIDKHVLNTLLTLNLYFFLLNFVRYQSYKNAPPAKPFDSLVHSVN